MKDIDSSFMTATVSIRENWTFIDNVGADGLENSLQIAPSKFLLRATDRKRSSRVLGFHDSLQRRPHSTNAQIMDGTLQSWTSTFPPRTGNAGSEFAKSRRS